MKIEKEDLFSINNIEMNRESELTILSFGGGQDSTAILLLLINDAIFRAKYAAHRLLVLFADTGNEHPFTYTYIDEVIIPLCKKHDIEFVAITNDMGFHGETWMTLQHQWENNNPTIGSLAYPKTCTHNLKLQPQYRYVQQWIPKNYPNVIDKASKDNYNQHANLHGKIRWLVGIARGEERRVADASKETAKWKRNAVQIEYPLIDIGYDRQDCQDYINSTNTALPMPSNCMFCPFGSQGMELLWMFHSYPDRFEEWIELEQKKLEHYVDQYDFIADFKKDPSNKDKSLQEKIVIDWNQLVTIDILKIAYAKAKEKQMKVSVRVNIYHPNKEVEAFIASCEMKKIKTKNLGVSGRLHKSSTNAVTLRDVLEEAKVKFPNVTLAQLNEYKWSHGHCVSSQY